MQNEVLETLRRATVIGDVETVTAVTATCPPDIISAPVDKDGNTLLHIACSHGSLPIAQHLVTQCKANPDCQNNKGETPLHYASKNGHLCIIQCLIFEKSQVLVDNRGNIALRLASEYGHLAVVRYLINKYKCDMSHIYSNREEDMNVGECKCNATPTNKDGITLLHLACLKGHLEVAKYLVDELKCSTKIVNLDKVTPLHMASQNGHLDVVQYLTSEKGCSAHCQDKDGNTPFLTCCLRSGSLSTVKYLITECKCDPKQSNNRGFTGLHNASVGGHLELARYLVAECKFDATATNKEGTTPLHYACLNGHLDVARYFLDELKCSAKIVNSFKDTPLHAASQNGHLDVVQYLKIEKGCNPHCQNKNGTTPLFTCCLHSGSLSTVKYLITECKCDPKQSHYRGFTALHCASQGGHLELARYLVAECKCNATATNKEGTTPLHLACLDGHLELAKYLVDELKCSAEVTINNCRDTSLHVASWNGHLDIIKYLIGRGYSPNQPGNGGQTLLHNSCHGGYLELTKFLINECRCDLKTISNNGSNAVHIASEEGHLRIIEFLTEKAATSLLEICNNAGKTPLMYAAECGHLSIVRHLVMIKGCDTHSKNADGLSVYDLAVDGSFRPGICAFIKFPSDNYCSDNCPSLYGCRELRIACHEGNIVLVKELIQKGIRPQCTDLTGKNCLHYASEGGHLNIVKLFVIKKLCDAGATDSMNQSALHYACSNGSLEIVEYLTQLNDPKQCNSEGYNAMHLACIGGHTDIVVYLIENQLCDLKSVDTKDRLGYHLACLHGHLSTLQYFINKLGSLPCNGSMDGQNCLHFLCIGGHAKIFVYVKGLNDLFALRNCIISKDFKGNTPFHYACQSGNLELVKMFISEYKPELCQNNASEFPHNLAWIKKHYDIVIHIIKEYKGDCDIADLKNFDGYNLGHCACELGDLELLKHLMEGALIDPLHPTLYGMSGLHFASLKGREDIVRFLAERNRESVFTQDSSGNTPLHYACQSGNNTLVEFFINDWQCDIDIVNRSGDSLIHIATRYNHPDVVEYLLSMECNPINENNRGDTPYAIANKIDPESCIARHYKYYFDAYKEHMVEKYIKVFIVGDHDTGKSTLFRNLQESAEGFEKLFYQFIKISNVSDNTSGVEQCMIDSHSFGKVHLYDFAGHEEYYTCNAAFLEFFTARVTGLFVILVDASKTINNIKESILRWISFIEGSCSRPDQKRFPPHVIIVGSHYDKLSKHELGIKYQQIEDILKNFSTSLKTFLFPVGIILLDCRKKASPGKITCAISYVRVAKHCAKASLAFQVGCLRCINIYLVSMGQSSAIHWKRY